MIQLTTNRKEVPTPYSFTEESFVWSITPTDKISPITIACPHDGMISTDLLGLFPKRLQGYSLVDRFVWQIIKWTLWHTPVNAIRGMLPRFMIDYNRCASNELYLAEALDLFEHDFEECCEDPQLLKYHHAYHQKIIETVSKSKELYGSKALFLDFHGFTKLPKQESFDIILGTANTHVVRSDIDTRFAEFMRLKGYGVFLPEYRDYPIGKDTRDHLDGGFTVRNVFLKTGVDSMQVEICKEIREDKERIEKLAADIGEFLESIS